MKKKMLLLLLLALLLTTSAMAAQTPPAELIVKEDVLNLFSGILGPDGQYVAIIENPGSQPLSLHEAKLELLDKDGNVVSSFDIYACTPYEVAPGGIAYVLQEYLQISEEDVARVVSHKFTLSASEGYGAPAPINLPVTSTFAQQEAPSYFSDEKNYEGIITQLVENNTDATTYDIQVFSILRDKDGKLVTLSNATAYDIGILPGSKVELRSRMPSGLLTKLIEQQREPATVESVVLVLPAE